jgi:hypothetical protein
MQFIKPRQKGFFGRASPPDLGGFGAFIPGGSGISIQFGEIFCSFTMLKRNADDIPAFLRISVRRKH